MCRRAFGQELLTVLLALSCVVACTRADEKSDEQPAVQAAFKKFAAAVADDNYDQFVKCIAPPADKFFTIIGTLQTGAAKYESALDEKFGKGEVLRSPLDNLQRVKLAEHYYEARGTIREVKPAGKDRVHVTIWTKGPVFRDSKDESIYESKITAVKIGGEWKFQPSTPMGGRAVVKKVKRTTADGKAIEVYAEHDPKGSPDKEKWEELKPTSFDGSEEHLKRSITEFAKLLTAIQAETEQVKKGVYKTRKEALDELLKASPVLR